MPLPAERRGEFSDLHAIVVMGNVHFTCFPRSTKMRLLSSYVAAKFAIFLSADQNMARLKSHANPSRLGHDIPSIVPPAR